MHSKNNYILFLCSWFPRKGHIKGIFVEEHINCFSKKFPLVAINLQVTNKFKLFLTKEIRNNYTLYTIYYLDTKIQLLNNLIAIILSYFYSLKIMYQLGMPNFIHVEVLYPLAITAYLLSKTKKIKYCITEHLNIYYKKNDTLLGRYFRKKVMKNSEFVTVCSKFMISAMKSYGVEAPVEYLPNVISVKFDKNLLNIQKKSDNFIHISSMDDKKKNISSIIECVNLLCSDGSYSNIKLHIVGKGKDYNLLVNLAKKYNLLGTNIIFHGFLYGIEKFKLLRECIGHILFSNYEGFSVVTAESILVGTPVIVTKCGGPEDFVNKDTGILINKNNINELKEAILFLKNNFNKYDTLKMHKYITDEFACDNVNNILKNLYKKYKLT